MIKLNKPSKVTPIRRKRNSEEACHQKVYFRWLSIALPYARALTFAIPNGGKRSVEEGSHLKAQGVTAGVCDVFMSIPNQFSPGLYIEFKAGKNTLTPSQAAFIARVREAGYRAEVCYSYEAAKQITLDYLQGTNYV